MLIDDRIGYMQYLPSPVDDVLLCCESDCSINESNYNLL